MKTRSKRTHRDEKDTVARCRRWCSVLLLLALTVALRSSSDFVSAQRNTTRSPAPLGTASNASQAFDASEVVFVMKNGPSSWDPGAVYALDAASGQERWHVTTDAPVLGIPAVADGSVYFGTDLGDVYSVELETGHERWRVDVGDNVRASSPLVWDGLVYVGTLVTSGSFEDVLEGKGTIYALEATTGHERWHRDTKYGVTGRPVESDGMIYVAVDKDRLYALEEKTGDKVWSYQVDFEVSSPIALDKKVFVTTERSDHEHVLTAFDAANGDIVWMHSTEEESYALLTGANGTLYIHGDGGSDEVNRAALDAVDAVTGQQRWQFTTVGVISTSAVVANGGVYFGTVDCPSRKDTGFWLICETKERGVLYAVDVETGQERWSVSMTEPIYSTPVIVGQSVYVDVRDILYAFDSTTGQERWHVAVGT